MMYAWAVLQGPGLVSSIRTQALDTVWERTMGTKCHPRGKQARLGSGCGKPCLTAPSEDWAGGRGRGGLGTD